MKLIKVLTLFICFNLSTSVLAALPKEERVPGGVALVELPTKYNGSTPPTVQFQDQPVAVFKKPSMQTSNQWIAVVGLPLSFKPGMASLVVKSPQFQEQIPFKVENKTYPQERLSFKKKRYYQPDPKQTSRIQSEALHLKKVFSNWTPNLVEDFKLVKPISGRDKKNFGKRRVINGKPKSPHKGLDIAAPIGTPIKAARAGIVEDIGEYFYTGKTVVLDHGQGFKTIYCHLNEVNVKKQQYLDAAAVLGTVGQTGRATGPHLHFGVNLNNVRVSPALFFVN